MGEHREQQIWEKQSGGLFRSDCATLGIPSSVPITVECLLTFNRYFYPAFYKNGRTTVRPFLSGGAVE